MDDAGEEARKATREQEQGEQGELEESAALGLISSNQTDSGSTLNLVCLRRSTKAVIIKPHPKEWQEWRGELLSSLNCSRPPMR